MKLYVVLVGSNINADVNVPSAIGLVRNHHDLTLRDVSGVFESRAVMADGNEDASRPVYRNAALLVETALETEELRSVLRDIEALLGRQRRNDKYADRTADLDIIATQVHGEVAETDPSIREMAFAAVPAAEVAAEWVVDSDGRTIGDLAQVFFTHETQIRRIE